MNGVSAKSTLNNVLFVSILAIFATFFYWPALHGWFIFDDFPNLENLQYLKGAFDLDKVRDFVFGGISSKLGRPLSLVTFVPQSEYWFVSAFPFKLVNLFIHVINGFLVYLISLHLFSMKKIVVGSISSSMLAGLVAFIWVFHPLNVSSVAYIIQRMALLSGFFILLSIYLYLKMHAHLVLLNTQSDNTGPGYRGNYFLRLLDIKIMLFAVVLGGLILLGVLSKENAALTCLGFLALSVTLLQTGQRISNFNFWVIYVPIIMGLIVFIILFESYILNGYRSRDFTLHERLLTEARILFSYITTYFLPLSSRLPFFNDHIVISTSLLAPLTTFFSLVAWGVIVIISMIYRRKLVWFSFAVFWYLGFHFLESGLFALELYYEHRNYIPIVGITIASVALSAILLNWLKRLRLNYGAAGLRAVIVIWFMFILYTGYSQSKLWGQPLNQASYWFDLNPKSLRSADHLGNSYLNAGFYEQADAIFDRMSEISEHPVGGLHKLYLSCVWDGVEKLTVEELTLRSVKAGDPKRVANYVDFLISLLKSGNCIDLDVAEVKNYVDGLILSPRYNQKYDIYRYRANLSALSGKWNEALSNLDYALGLSPSEPNLYDVLMDKVNVLLVFRALPEARELIGFLNTKTDNMLAVQKHRFNKLVAALPEFEVDYESKQ